VIHLLAAELALYRPGQHTLDEDVLLQHQSRPEQRLMASLLSGGYAGAWRAGTRPERGAGWEFAASPW
jgi:hypothetical protein